MQMPTIGEPHKKLHRLEGNWEGEETMHPSPWDPTGGTAKATIKNTVGLNGFVVIQDYSQERNGQVSFRGHAVFGHDGMKNDYTIMWWDSMGFPAHEFRGDFTGNTLSYESKTAQGFTRAMFDFKDDDHYFHKMEVSNDGQNWKTFMEGNYTRRK